VEQGPDELSDREEDRDEELDKITNEPLDGSEDKDGGQSPSVADAQKMGG
jgi:hypothetical protein